MKQPPGFLHSQVINDHFIVDGVYATQALAPFTNMVKLRSQAR